MKIAYIVSRFPKLTETFVLCEMMALERFGARIELFPLLRERQAVTHPEAQAWTRRAHYLPFISGPILRANWRYLSRTPFRYLKLWADVLAGTWRSPNFFAGAIGILPKTAKIAYDIQMAGIAHVHAHFANHPAMAAFIIHRLTGIPYSFTAHGSDLHVDRRMLDAKVEQAAFVVAISSYNRNVILQECGEGVRDKVNVIHCGIDPWLFSPPPRQIMDSTVHFLSVGSLEPVKGHRHLIEACRILRERGIKFLCHLVGEGRLRAEIERQIQRSGLKEHVILHGALPRAIVAERLKNADIAVLASVPTREGKREGIPVVLMEAMATALPVVSSDLSGIPELVESGNTGLLVPPGDARGLAAALEELCLDGQKRRRMGAAGREKILREFDLGMNAQQLLTRIWTLHNAYRALPLKSMAK